MAQTHHANTMLSRALPQLSHARSLGATRGSKYLQKCGIAHVEPALKDIPLVKFIDYTPPDPMHTELKGNLDIHLYAFLYQATHVHKWFTRPQFNSALLRFNFGDRVPPVRKNALKGTKGNLPKSKGSVVWTAGHMYAFTIRSIPFFQSFLSAEALRSDEWKAWAAHANYFADMMRWRFTKASVYELDAKIQLAQKRFKKIKNYKTLWKPKNHFSQHIPRAITKFGPCRLFWCMRYEGKHREFKRASRLGNFHHVPSQLASFWAKRTHLRLRRSSQKKSRKAVAPGELISSEPFDPSTH